MSGPALSPEIPLSSKGTTQGQLGLTGAPGNENCRRKGRWIPQAVIPPEVSFSLMVEVKTGMGMGSTQMGATEAMLTALRGEAVSPTPL